MSVALTPLPEEQTSPGPWTCNDEATVHDAEGRCVCVMGDPFEGVTERDIANGAAVVALPVLVETLRQIAEQSGEAEIARAAGVALRAAGVAQRR